MSCKCRSTIFLTDEERHYRLIDTVKKTLRHYVALDDMKSTCDPFYLRKDKSEEEKAAELGVYSTNTLIDLGSAPLFHKVSTLCPTTSITLSI